MTRAAAYLRTSRVGDRPEDRVQDWQKDACERWAAARGVEIVETYADLDQSGGKDDRPALEEALQAVERGEVEGILVARLDRFSRSLPGALATIRRLDDAGGKLLSAEETLDTSTPAGELQLHILLSFSHYYLATVKRQWQESQRSAIEAGKHIAPRPFGYRAREDGILEPDPEESPLVRTAYELASQNRFAEACRILEEHGGRAWNSGRVKRFLASRIYLGEVALGELRNSSAHEALVSEAVWEAAQQPDGRSPSPSAEYPLSGFPICASCGGPMTGSQAGGCHRSYRCSSKSNGRRSCPAPVIIMASRLEDYVLERLSELSKGMPGWLVGDADDEAVSRAENALRASEEELQAFASDLEARRLLGDAYHPAMRARVEAVEEAQEEYRGLAKRHAQRLVTPAEVTDKQSLPELAKALTIVVARGRGKVQDRVKVDLADTSAGESFSEHAEVGSA